MVLNLATLYFCLRCLKTVKLSENAVESPAVGIFSSFLRLSGSASVPADVFVWSVLPPKDKPSAEQDWFGVWLLVLMNPSLC